MKDINIPLREAYFQFLSLTEEAVYYMQAPDSTPENPRPLNYIVYGGISTTPVAIKSGETVTTSITINIYTENVQYNDGNAVDIITMKVKEKIELIDIDPLCQIVETTLQSDNTDSFVLKNQIIAIDRRLVFQHKIYIR